MIRHQTAIFVQTGPFLRLVFACRTFRLERREVVTGQVLLSGAEARAQHARLAQSLLAQVLFVARRDRTNRDI